MTSRASRSDRPSRPIVVHIAAVPWSGEGAQFDPASVASVLNSMCARVVRLQAAAGEQSTAAYSLIEPRFRPVEVASVLAKHLSRVDPQRRFVAGVGHPVGDEASAEISARQAEYAARTILANSLDLRAAWYGQALFLELLVRSRDLADEVVRAFLGPLLEHRRARDYLHTLDAYLLAGGNVKETAARIHLNRRTLGGRLRDIAALTRSDLQDGAARAALRLALHALMLPDSPEGKNVPL